jgi:hypothetical protein
MTDATVRMLMYDDQVAAGMIEDEVTLKRLIAEGKVEFEPETSETDVAVLPSHAQRKDQGRDGETDETPPRLDDLAQVLDATLAFVTRYVVFPSQEATDAFVLWIGHTHAIDAFESTPRLALQSAEKQSGKTRAQEVAELLVARPLPMVNISVPALFRSIEGDGAPPTIIMDEVDTIFGPKAPDGSEDLRGLLNAGHRRGRRILRCVGPSHEVKPFASFAPVMLAGIGDLPDTIEDRSVIIRMRRRAPGEVVEPFRYRSAEYEATSIRESFDGLSSSMVTKLEGFYPIMPDWLTDRPADVWEPLFAVADLAGGDWPQRARDAARALLDEQAGTVSLGVRLLGEIRIVFGDEASLPTEMLLTRLKQIDEAPWAEWNITSRWLAQHLKPFGVTSKNVPAPAGVTRQLKGYERVDFLDPWKRYLPEVPSHPSPTYEQGIRETATPSETATSVLRPRGRP